MALQAPATEGSHGPERASGYGGAQADAVRAGIGESIEFCLSGALQQQPGGNLWTACLVQHRVDLL